MLTMIIKGDDEKEEQEFKARGKTIGALMLKASVLSMDYKFCCDIKKALDDLRQRNDF